MHRVLCIAEIVSSISQEIPHDSLPSFARVCKAFSDPALDVLWSKQTGLENLLRCMPAGMWNESSEDSDSEEEEDSTWALKRPLIRSDWDRPLLYARRVKSFEYDDRFAESTPSSSKFLDTLRLSFPNTCIFPNLQELIWYSTRGLTLPHIRLFLGPHLHTLSVAVIHSRAHLSLLPILAAECPSLKEVVVECCDELDGRNSVSSFILELRHLYSLTLPDLNTSALEHIARLPNLTSLTLESQSVLDPFPPTLVLNAILFPRLSYLNIRGEDVKFVAPLLPVMAHAPLADLYVGIPTECSGASIAQCYSALAHHCLRSHASLKRLECADPDYRLKTPPNTDMSAYIVNSTQFLPLLSFRNITIVELTAPIGFDLDDTTVAGLAEAWPHLSSLSLFSDVFVNQPSRITPNGLLPLAQHCPHLANLTLPLDASIAPKWPLQRGPKGAGQRIKQTSLTSLTVKRSPIANPLMLAGFLSSVFPKLTRISTEHRFKRGLPQVVNAELAEAIAMHDRWKTVEAALPVLRKARVEERSWTRSGKRTDK
ncbi:hypothetical protein R3P38DRAFT_2690112 [Favolaschia claudopus]|uniref:F-box domain-containing protein n=1 Tax=Favolaschia claudopus TaxID=2862362 RepID=A0AAW0CYW8_9AGAR